MSDFWVLDGRGVRRATIVEWAKQLDAKENIVCQTQVGETRVSTVCLGIDHNVRPSGPPVLFETMLFPGDETTRYISYDEALAGHMAIVYRLQQEADDAP